MIERTAAPITCILPLERNVYTGDEDGRVVSRTSNSDRGLKLTTCSMSGIVCSGTTDRVSTNRIDRAAWKFKALAKHNNISLELQRIISSSYLAYAEFGRRGSVG